MKMKFIPLLFVLGCIASNSQITTTNGAKFFVSPGTTLFSTGDITIDNSSDVFTNKGNVKISEGTLKNNGSPNKFVITYDDEKNYGQLIIVNNKSTVGGVTMQKHLYDYGSGEVLFGVPFIKYTYDNFSGDLTSNRLRPELICTLFSEGNNCRNSSRWNRHPLFTWREDRFRYDPFQKNENFVPGKYYSFRKEMYNTGSNFDGIISFQGTPYVAGTKPTDGSTASVADLSIPVGSRVASGYNIGNNAKNGYGLYYWTYLDDPFAATIKFTKTTTNEVLNSNRYWDRMLRMVNPYTSNIDLTILLKDQIPNIIGGASDGPITNKIVDGTTRYEGKTQMFTFDNDGKLIGDDIRIIPPMTNFFIKAKSDYVKVDLYKDSKPQTFEQSKYEFNKGKVWGTRSKSNSQDLYQLNLELVSGKTFYGNTYLAAGPNLITGELNEFEAKIKSNTENDNDVTTNIYTIPESINGGKYPGYEDTELYINVINSDNSSKVAVPVGVTVNTMDKGKEFTFKSELKYNMNPIKEEGKSNFDNPNAKFYFHDKQLKVIKEIDSNFSYSVTLNESTNDRFEIFWKEPGTLGNEDITTLNGLTTIYKTGNEYKIHFDQNWKKAEVTIFNVLGQLISTETNIDTQNDYLLPVHTTSSSLYVIVVTNQITGEKVTKKIVK